MGTVGASADRGGSCVCWCGWHSVLMMLRSVTDITEALTSHPLFQVFSGCSGCLLPYGQHCVHNRSPSC
eukprot:11169057-Lingulodinium_polyedra.AAC.1